MDLKKSNAPVNTTTIDKNLVDQPTGNIYEAISVISKRANQINTDIKYYKIRNIAEIERK